MLQIIPSKGRALDLPPDIQVSLTIENPLLKEDRIPTPFSLSFELPPTRHNLEVFGWPDRIGSYRQSTYVRTAPVNIFFNAISIAKGHLKLTSYMENLKVTFFGVDYIDGIKSKLYELDFGREIFAGSYTGAIDFSNPSNFAYSYKQWAESAVTGNRDDFVVAPIALLDVALPFSQFEPRSYEVGWTRPTEGYDRFRSVYRHQDSAFLNLYNPYQSNFIIARSTSENHKVGLSHANIFPLFRVGHIFNKILGKTLVSNFFNQGDLRNLVMPSFFYTKWEERLESMATDNTYNNRSFPPMVENPRPAWNAPYPTQPYLEYKNFMPDITAADFVKNLLSLFCLSLFPVKGKLNMRSNSEVMGSPVNYNWNPKVLGLSSISTEPKKTYSYSFPSTDKYNGTEQFISVASVGAMVAYPYDLGNENYYEERFFIEETGQRFIKRATEIQYRTGESSGAVKNEIDYELIDDRLGVEIESESQKYTVEPSVEPLPLYPATAFKSMENDAFLSADTYSITVPAFSAERAKRSSTIPLVFAKGMRSVPGDSTKSYPYASIYPDSINNLNLLWDGEHGLVEKYHKDYKTWIEREKLRLQGTFILNAIDLHTLDLGNKVHVNGRNFFIEKLQITIRSNTIDPAVVDLIEA